MKPETKEEAIITRCCKVIDSCETQAQLFVAREYIWLATEKIRKASIAKFLDTQMALKRRLLNCHLISGLQSEA